MKFLGCLFLLLGLSCPLCAQSISSSVQYDVVEEHFSKGQWEAAAGVAIMFGPFVATHNRPTHDYAMVVVDVGYMLTDVKEWGPAHGNFECVGELFGGGVFKGRGNYVAGFTLLGRYNLVQPGWKLVPYCQIGAGCGGTDIDQRIVGQVFQFNLHAAVGARYFIKSNVALSAEYRYQHTSNANTGRHNLGINTQGVALAMAWFY